MSMKITENYRSLSPAYGRDFKSAKDAKDSFLSGKDWIDSASGSYCSVSDFAAGVTVNLRYKKLHSVAVVKVPKASSIQSVKAMFREVIREEKPKFFRVVAIQPVTFFHSVPKVMETLGIDESKRITLAVGESFDCRYHSEQEQLLEMFPEQLVKG
jgi:hypothetical protein